MELKKSDLLQGTLDLLILKTLASGSLHGYAIAQRILITSRETLDVQQGSLYPAINRLEEFARPKGFTSILPHPRETHGSSQFE